MAAIPSLYVPAAGLPQSNATSWLGQLGTSLGGAIDQASQNKSFGKLADIIQQTPQVQQNGGGFLSGLIPSKQPAATSSAPIGNTSPGQPNQIYNDFIGTVQKGGLTNPYGLAAVAATGRAESGYDPGKLNAAWPDPSQSGQPGTSGGLLSWRNERLANLRNYAQSQGVDPNNIPASVQGQFFLQENPQLVQQLNSAKTPQEAAALMANAWKFAGYDQQGGEAARRAALAQNYYATQFANQQPQPTQVASLDPSAGMTTAYRDPQVSAPNAAAQAINAVAPQTPAIDPATATPDQMLAALGPSGVAPAPAAAQAPVAAPQQVAQAAPQAPSNGILAAGIAPANRQNISSQQIADLVRDPNTRQVGLALWQQVATGKTAEPWQFVQLPDGTLARANQATGQVEAVGKFAKTDNGVTNVNGTLVKNADGAVVYQGQPKLPNSYQEFQLAQQNGFQGSYADWQRIKQPNVNVNNSPNSNKFVEKSDEAAAKRFDDIVTAGQAAPQAMADMQQLLDLGTKIGTGGAAQVKATLGPYASALGINIDGLDEIQAYQAITSRLAPQMRAVGSGSSSDRDVSLFFQSLPSIRNRPGANEMIANTVKAVAQNKINAAAIARQAQSGKITWQEADDQISKLPDPYELFKQFQQQSGTTSEPKKATIGGYTIEEVSP